jgi:hypothetical protein
MRHSSGPRRARPDLGRAAPGGRGHLAAALLGHGSGPSGTYSLVTAIRVTGSHNVGMAAVLVDYRWHNEVSLRVETKKPAC